MNEALGRTVPCAGRCGRRVPAQAALYSHTATGRGMLALCDYCGAVAEEQRALTAPVAARCGHTACHLGTNH